MTALGFNHPLYILPFDYRGSFETKMFGWKGMLQTRSLRQSSSSTMLSGLHSKQESRATRVRRSIF